MDRTFLAGLVLAALVVFLVLIVVGWRSRKRRQHAISAPQPVPAEIGTVHGTFRGYYVATTLAGDRLNRVAVHGLGFRAKTAAVVAEAGVVVPIAGQADTFIPRADITSVARATWTIDRVVEPDGLTMIAWSLGDTPVESYFRMDDNAAFLAALTVLAPRTTQNTTTETDAK